MSLMPHQSVSKWVWGMGIGCKPNIFFQVICFEPTDFIIHL
jgi:hypothetical protein